MTTDPEAGNTDVANVEDTSEICARLPTVSELASKQSSEISAPSWLRWFEYPFHVKEPKTGIKLPEAAGWAMDSAARGPINHLGAIMGNTLLILAAMDAGCTKLAGCEERILGFKPSSLLSATSSIILVIAAIIMPVAGAIVDHTSYRKTVGSISALVLLVVTAAQIGISPSTWEIMLIIDAIGGFTLILHLAAALAYLPDLSSDQDVLSHYTSRFSIRQYFFQSSYMILSIIAGNIIGVDGTIAKTLRLARVSASLCFGMSLLLLSYAWIFLFRKRPPLSAVPEGSNLLTAGFLQVGRTSRKIWADYSALKWFMLSLLWSPELGGGVVMAIFVTFFTVQIGMNAQDVQYLSIAYLLACMIPGSLMSKWANTKLNPLNSYRLAVFLFGVVFFVTAAILTGPEKKVWSYIMTVLVGVQTGWMYPSQRVLLCTLTPRGQEAEMMGVFVFIGQILAWLPVVIFTFMNEAGYDMRWGVGILGGFCILAVIFTLPMGSYDAAVAAVANGDTTIQKEVSDVPTTEIPTTNDPTSDVDENMS